VRDELLRRARGFVRRLPPGSFAFVMATGILSTAFAQVEWSAVSVVLLVIAVAGGVLIAVAQVWRLCAHWAEVRADVRNPAVSFGFLTVVAAINVVGVRLFTPQAPLVTIVLTIASVPLWILLVYGLPAALMLGPTTRPAIQSADGSWFLWVVSTQSLAVAMGVLGQHYATEVLAALATALWGIGVMLYLMLATLVTLKLLTAAHGDRTMNPSYWIYMGATAITVLAGSQLVGMPLGLPIVEAVRPVVAGFTYVLWAFGVWWIPLLVVFGLWRHLVRRVPLRYEAGLWSIVFPLGMFSVASVHFGRAEHLELMTAMGVLGIGVAAVAWLLVFVAMCTSALAGIRTGSGQEAA
jgi:tellurite resistance protein TehA-like permease